MDEGPALAGLGDEAGVTVAGLGHVEVQLLLACASRRAK